MINLKRVLHFLDRQNLGNKKIKSKLVKFIKEKHTSGGSIALSTASLIMKNAINKRKSPFTKPAKTSDLA